MDRRESALYRSLPEVADALYECRLCPRLARYREEVPARKSFRSDEYWRRPVPGFGDPEARLVVIGLAPAAHGGNRTGRVFTGDKSGSFLVKALYEAGFASQPTSERRDDGLAYTDCYLTAAVKCVPPQDKPTAEEFGNCSRWLGAELRLLTNARVVVALGNGAFDAYLRYARGRGAATRGMAFGHGKRYALGVAPPVFASFHPSPRNTNTGKLSEEMLVSLFRRVREELGGTSRYGYPRRAGSGNRRFKKKPAQGLYR